MKRRRKPPALPTILLKCEDDSFDQRVHHVGVAQETEASWMGHALDTPSFPLLEYPKYAWKKAT